MSKEAMKLALEALQKIYIAPEHEEYIRVWWPACEQAITALREALTSVPDWASEAKEQPAPATELREQEPVAYLVDGDLYYPEEIDWETLQEQGHTVASLYTSPPAQRTWVSLTDEEIYSVLENLQVMHHRPPTTDSRIIFARAIEAKLRSKNEDRN